ncbi:hypothetical protein VOLCADRAFT_90770 [Volvox carteri f. nagariensis]|uniref:mRNA (guanine-N(7))-methyltransferase n=1 Tax=Volvox carteri f. nagariensis TaxID=3068 RepID=D8TVP6_VOLCA|nr:uncharacterized protein VOLCADRAFT_90770 [Volvox carteri f. nagariensis]EFJ48490.1 hypothetical protein VOLCADRAFT_90770 [Volvox carteri f. nagariensis]|eukprot:XP_002950289.1 hypothetical protein VOLCADRAFT_90770 [Volvox carteri f. nagariensis]
MADHGGGGSGAWEQQRHHYNSHASTTLSTREALKQRSEGPAQELKNFHNHVKRQLILRFAHKQERLLDLCCGRGGDLQKWREAQVGYVRGLDISEREVDEARRRFQELGERRSRGPGSNMVCEFQAVDWLGERPYDDPVAGPGSYGVVTCMFALHYFFVSEGSLRMFLRNVSANLRYGGYFIGTVPSGRRVMHLLGGRPEFRSPMLRLKRRWQDPFRPPLYGAGYICDIADTVTASLEGATEGSLEYLVDLPTLERVAAAEGLLAVRDYMDPVLASNFKDEDLDAPFKHFKPFFLHSLQLDEVPGNPPPMPPSSLERASALFAAFVFQKVNSPDAISVPLAPECSFMQERKINQHHQQHGRGFGAPGGGGGGGPPGMGPPMGGPNQLLHPHYNHMGPLEGPMGHMGQHHQMGGGPGGPRDLSAALWRPSMCAAELLKQRKQCARDIGFIRSHRTYLHVEEAVVVRAVVRTVVRAVVRAVVISVGVPLERYQLYGSLSRSGYLVWGGGAWAACYSRTPAVPGALPPQPMQQQLVAARAATAAAATAAGDAATPMDVELPGGPTAAAAEAATATDGLRGVGVKQRPPSQQPHRLPPPRRRRLAVTGADPASPPPPPSASSPSTGCRGWWREAGPDHPHLQGLPAEYFRQQPPGVVADRLSVSLRTSFPNLQPLDPIRSAAPTAAAAEAVAAANTAPRDDAEPVATGGGARSSSSSGGGIFLGIPSNNAHLVFDVYKPGSFVSRYKGQLPAVQTHVAICSAAPPTLGEMHAADAAAASAAVAAPGEPERPASVTWATVLNGDVALFSFGEADLLCLL